MDTPTEQSAHAVMCTEGLALLYRDCVAEKDRVGLFAAEDGRSSVMVGASVSRASARAGLEKRGWCDGKDGARVVWRNLTGSSASRGFPRERENEGRRELARLSGYCAESRARQSSSSWIGYGEQRATAAAGWDMDRVRDLS
jgi:hypothetical protein